jgi:hypothetical protein
MSWYTTAKTIGKSFLETVSVVGTANRIANEVNLNKAYTKMKASLPDADQFYNYEKMARYMMVRSGVGKTLLGVRALVDYDDRLRNDLESESMQTAPTKCTKRAVCYAALIYQWATHNKGLDLARIEEIIWPHLVLRSGPARTRAEVAAWGTRNYGQLSDPRVGWAIVVVRGRSSGRNWKQVYVVFRGSRGDQPGDRIKNPMGAGWAEAQGAAAALDPTARRLNIDWRANFDNQQVPLLYAGGPYVQVHRGFKTVYDSMRLLVRIQLQQAMRDGPGQVFVTGHSLGGALATLCAFDLAHNGYDPVCLSFNAPRVGNQTFAVEFNQRLADQTFTCADEGRTFSRAFRFDQKNDLVTWGQKYAFLNEPDPRSDLFESSAAYKGLDSGRTMDDLLQAYFHVKHRKTVSFRGFHSYTQMMDSILGYNASSLAGLFDYTS